MATTRRSILETIDTDRFLDMPVTAQLLYFHLAIRADSNGYVLSPNAISRMLGCTEDDMKTLNSLGYISQRPLTGFGARIITDEERLTDPKREE